MKKILVIILAVILTLTLLLTSVTFGAGGKKDVALAQEAGQAWLDRTVALTGEPLEWVGASLATPQVCYGLDGQPSAYMFAMENDGEVVGYIIVGSSAYGYPMFEAADVPPPSIPSADEARSIVQRDLGLEVEEIGKPIRLLYLGFDNIFAVYEAAQQDVAVNLFFDYALPASDLKTAMPSPQEYKTNKEATEQSRPVPLYGAGGSKRLDMTYYACGDRKWCGPCSGTSIMYYYRHVRGHYKLPDSEPDIYDALKDAWGKERPIWPYEYGYGVVYMAANYHDFTFGYSWDYDVDDDDYWNRVNDINNYWPVAVFGCPLNYPPEYEPDPWPHWVAMRGYCYEYGYWNYEKILCTDSLRRTNWLWLDWDCLGLMINTVTIMDY